MKQLLVVLLALAGVAAGQSDRGRITGRITDASGAVVATATVTVENLTTDARRQTNAGTDGRFLVDALLSSTYTVTATAPGFADTVVTDLVLSVGQERTLDFTLQPASFKRKRHGGFRRSGGSGNFVGQYRG